jgi:hypothetical protein
MSYRIAGIDVHKKMLAVVVSDVDGVQGKGRPSTTSGTHRPPGHCSTKLKTCPSPASLLCDRRL